MKQSTIILFDVKQTLNIPFEANFKKMAHFMQIEELLSKMRQIFKQGFT